MQCLLSISDLTKYFKQKKFSKKTQPLSLAFQNFIFDYQNEKVFDPQSFILALRSKIRLFNGKHQDAHQFFVEFLDLLIDEQGSSKSELYSIFGISIEDRVTCKTCSTTSKVLMKLTHQYLFIRESVQKSINHYLETEDPVDLRSPWKCYTCKAEREAGIKHSILDTSLYIIIHLNRFLGLDVRNNNSIEIDSLIVVNGRKYECIGVVCQMGSLSCGHYTAHTKRNGAWYIFDDSTFRTSSESCDGTQPYIVFYKKTE